MGLKTALGAETPGVSNGAYESLNKWALKPPVNQS